MAHPGSVVLGRVAVLRWHHLSAASLLFCSLCLLDALGGSRRIKKEREKLKEQGREDKKK